MSGYKPPWNGAIVAKQFGYPWVRGSSRVEFGVPDWHQLGEDEEWVVPPAYRPADILGPVERRVAAAQERLHRQIGQWARVGHRRVRERAHQARLAMGLEDRTYQPRPK